jgi:hypothetical protein
MKKLLILILMAFSMNAMALSFKDKTNLAMVNLIDDYLTCYVFFTIGIKGSGQMKNRSVVRLKNSRDYMLKMVILLSKEMKFKKGVLESKVKMFTRSQLNLMDNHFKNFSLLLSKHGNQCKQLGTKGGFENQMRLRFNQQGFKL